MILEAQRSWKIGVLPTNIQSIMLAFHAGDDIVMGKDRCACVVAARAIEPPLQGLAAQLGRPVDALTADALTGGLRADMVGLDEILSAQGFEVGSNGPEIVGYAVARNTIDGGQETVLWTEKSVVQRPSAGVVATSRRNG